MAQAGFFNKIEAGDAMEKMDIKKDFKSLYHASATTVVEVYVPTLNYLMVDGQGDPNTAPAYVNAVQALFAMAYAVKFLVKKSILAIDYGVMPLESLWWVQDMSKFSIDDKSNWQWTAMIMQPAFVTSDCVAGAMKEVAKKRPALDLSQVRFATFSEGRCAQTLHIGPFSEEGPTIAKVHQFIEARGQRTGKHHEIYMSDIRKAAPSKWKTIIRQSMQ